MGMICNYCKTEYKGRPASKGRRLSRFCCAKCAGLAKRKDKEKEICVWCKQEYSVRPSATSSTFCSRKCVDLSRRREGFIEGEDRRDSKEQRQWRLNVFKKDNFTCQKCNSIGTTLNAHHILAYARYPEARVVEDNGATLCEECHKEFHRLYGITEFTDKDYWEWV